MAFAVTRFQPDLTSTGDSGPRCRQRSQPTSSEHKMREYLLVEWCSIPPVQFKKLAESMTRGIKAVLSARDGQTPY